MIIITETAIAVSNRVCGSHARIQILIFPNTLANGGQSRLDSRRQRLLSARVLMKLSGTTTFVYRFDLASAVAVSVVSVVSNTPRGA